jgi:hypothetical protein
MIKNMIKYFAVPPNKYMFVPENSIYLKITS